MASKDSNTAPNPVERLELTLDVYGRVISGVMMLLGLRQWAIIIGIINGSGSVGLEQMPTAWQFATAHLAVVDLVASVGLWQRTAWGNVVWIYAALAEIAMHTVFIQTFGSNYLIVFLHAAAIVGFATILLMLRRAAARE